MSGSAAPGWTGPLPAADPADDARRAWPDEPDPAYLDADADEFAPTGEEIYAAPAAEDDLADPAPDTPRPAPDTPRPAEPSAPQPAFHRMWSSPTPPGDEDEG